MNKKILGLGLALVLCLSLSVPALAAYSYGFSATLPANQGDTEVSKVSRGTDSEYWHIRIDSATQNVKKVHAWTEGGLGDNYSSPSKTVSVGSGYAMKYDRVVPNEGQNVVLNLDNPNSVSYTVDLEGSWDPD